MILGFPDGSDDKESACYGEDMGSIPGSVRFPGVGRGNPLQYLPGESPWTEEPGGLQSMGLQRIGHEYETKPGIGRGETRNFL